MAKVHLSVDLPVPAQTIWGTVGGFNDLARWHPAVSRSEESHDGIRVLRTLHLHGGGTILEQQEARDEAMHTYSYTILDGPLPVRRYTSTLHVKDNPGQRGCTVEWLSEFEPSGVPESEAVKAIRGIYEAGFANLRRMFGSGS